jgi:hypothetical protein
MARENPGSFVNPDNPQLFFTNGSQDPAASPTAVTGWLAAGLGFPAANHRAFDGAVPSDRQAAPDEPATGAHVSG